MTMSGIWVSKARIGLKLVLKTLLALPGLLLRRRGPAVRVLFYHRVNPYPFDGLGPVSREITVRPDAFGWQMDYLARNGFTVVGPDAFEAMLAGRRPIPPRTVLITFDDGFEDNALFAAPVLAGAGFPAVVFTVGDFVGKSSADVLPHADRPEFGRFLSRQQLLDLQAQGIVIGSHTLTHPLLTRVDPARARQEVAGSRARLEAMLGRPVALFAYPGGDFDAAVERAVQAAGYAAAFTTATGTVAPGARPSALRRTEVSASDSRFVFRMKLAGALDWLAVKDGAAVRAVLGVANRLMMPLARARP